MTFYEQKNKFWYTKFQKYPYRSTVGGGSGTPPGGGGYSRIMVNGGPRL